MVATGLRGDTKEKPQILLGETKAAASLGKEGPGKEQGQPNFFPLETRSLSLRKKGKSPEQVDLSATTRQIYNIDQQNSNFDFICRDEGRLILDRSNWDRAHEMSIDGRGKGKDRKKLGQH